MPLRDSRHPGLTEPRPVGRGNYLRITYILFWPLKVMEGLPGWGISSMPRPPPRQHRQERRYTPSTHPVIRTRRIWKHDYDGKMVSGELVGLKLTDICLTGEEIPEKISVKNLSRPGIEPGPAALQARMLPLASQQWTEITSLTFKLLDYFLKNIFSIFGRYSTTKHQSLINVAIWWTS